MMRFVALLLLSIWVAMSSGFYLPGVNPQSFGEGDPVKLKVNKLTSVKTLLPLDYYVLPFCCPPGGPKKDNENLGEFLSGDRIESSPYYLEMRKDMYCEQLCISNLGRMEMPNVQPNIMVRAIRKNYHNNWILDNLSAASKVEEDDETEVRYWGGFPIGFISDDTKEAYVHNHVNIEIMYHPVETETNKYRVVRFTVEPFSIAHDFEPIKDSDNDILVDKRNLPTIAKLTNPIDSCRAMSNQHTNYDMITAPGRKAQLASGNVLFTYDVIWLENKDLKWASRWDIYLNMDGKIPDKVHWTGISTGLVIVILLSAMIVAILVRNLQRDINRYIQVTTDEESRAAAEEPEIMYSWELVHANVFRPPSFHPMLLCICCGTGAQLLGTSFFTIVFAALGFLSPARRGHLLMAVLLLYASMGTVNGYITARLYQTFQQGDAGAWQRTALITALAFPGFAFGIFFVVDIIAWTHESTLAVPFGTILVMPLVFAGANLGFQQDAIEFPVNTSSIFRRIPDRPWFMTETMTFLIGGILPFLSCFVELYYIMASVWMEFYYYTFGFLMLVFVILLLICAETTVLLSYFQLCNVEYHWGWRSFVNAGATALYVFVYSIFYFQQLEASSLATYILYFGYMALASVALWLMLGTVGLFSSLWFYRVIFAPTKI